MTQELNDALQWAINFFENIDSAGCSRAECAKAREVAAIITRHFAATPVVAREVYSELIHIAAELVKGEGFLSPCAEDHSARTPRGIIAAAQYQDNALKEWANRIRQVADRLSAATTSPSSETPELTDLQIAYNQGIEDALCAIRAESQGGGYWAATYINAIARRCSPFWYVAAHFTAPTYDQVVQAITDIREARESHAQWAAHLRDTNREDCKGCDDHAAHIGDAAYHDEWIAKYDNAIYVLAHAPFTDPAPVSPAVDGEGRAHLKHHDGPSCNLLTRSLL